MTTNPTIHQPEDYHREFDPDAYLNHFYSKKAAENGLKTALFAIPNFICRINQPKLDKLLDVGSGPTCYVALCCRAKVNEIYLTDYTTRSREELKKWLRGESTFDWSPISKSIALVEGICVHSDITAIEKAAREKTKAIWFCDVHLDHLLEPDNDMDSPLKDTAGVFDLVTTIFCLESACSNYEQYKLAMANVVRKVKPGGYLILGSVIEDTEYAFGTERFQLLYLTEEDICNAMELAGMDMSTRHSFENDGALMMMCRKPL